MPYTDEAAVHAAMTPDAAAVLIAMTRAGLQVVWDFPGMAVLSFTRDGVPAQVATGLHGWEYGTLSVLEGDTWQPVEDVTAEPGLAEGETDPETIAAAWAAWIDRRHRLGILLQG